MDRNFKFKICGRSDLNYANDPKSRRSITGTILYLNDARAFSSITQMHVMMSVTEAELVAVVAMVQDMMYIYSVVDSMGLKVELPMIQKLTIVGHEILQTAGALVGGQGM